MDYTRELGADNHLADSFKWMRVSVLRVREDGTCDVSSWRKGSPVLLSVVRSRLRRPVPWADRKPVMEVAAFLFCFFGSGVVAILALTLIRAGGDGALLRRGDEADYGAAPAIPSGGHTSTRSNSSKS